MDPIGTTKEAVDFLLKVIKFVRDFKDVPKEIKHSLDRSLESSENLRMWMDVFERLDQTSIPENYSANLLMKLTNLENALTSHRHQIEGWMNVMGLPACPIEEKNNTSGVSVPLGTERKSGFMAKEIVGTLRRTMFVFSGSSTVKSIEKKVKEAESDVMNVYLTIFPFATFKSFRPETDAAAELPMVRFLSAAKKRQEDGVPVNMIGEAEWRDLYEIEEVEVDEYIAHEYPLRVCTVHPRPERTEMSNTVPMLRGRYVCYSRSNDADEVESMNLARLFADDEENQSNANQFGTFRGDGDMLRLSTVVRASVELQYIFKLPPESTKVHTLRALLVDKQSMPLHPIAERVKFAIRLATSVLVVHSLGLVHKRIQPESILVIDSDRGDEFPYSLGYPYLVGFHLSRSANAKTNFVTDFHALAKRGIYSHPRDQVTQRTEKYSMISDIYSLGVCLFEVALWRSLFIVDPDGKSLKDYVPNKSSGFEKLADSYYDKGIPRSQRAKAKTDELIRIAKEEIPRILGSRFADVVVACLLAGYPDSPFADHDNLKTQDSSNSDPLPTASKIVSVKYLELVLKNLQAVYDGLSSNR
ncbi:hypothetical protein SCHPADRAFT_981803 [Schizopora paradoxa]|uniref:Protein kinase domain-containing protein n=1 Tax=Schizopora paradoxa TaxID=27342 RepID=A0A0H2RB73_9AGAM|nr:hypothetical protein SCHPADRAFT_981803 [Schizopora paradoxa]